MTRRTFLAAPAAAGGGLRRAGAPAHQERRAASACCRRTSATPTASSWRATWASSRWSAPPSPTSARPRRSRRRPKRAGVPIHSVMNQAHWKFPLSSADPAVVAESIEGHGNQPAQRQALGRRHRAAGARRGQPADRYKDAWDRSTAADPQADPAGAAAEGGHRRRERLEQVPAQPARVRRLRGPVQEPLGARLLRCGQHGALRLLRRTGSARSASASQKVHLKDFSFQKRTAEFTPLREGEIDWKEVYKALAEVGYQGHGDGGTARR